MGFYGDLLGFCDVFFNGIQMGFTEVILGFDGTYNGICVSDNMMYEYV